MFNWVWKVAGRRAEGLDRPKHTPGTNRTSVPTVMPKAGQHSVPVVDRPGRIGPDLVGKLDLLIRRSWGSRDDNQNGSFVFGAERVPAGDAGIFVTTLLKHVRLVAPRLNVPFMTPRIEISEIEDACGLFVEDNGWVKLVVSTEFALNPAASRAILCHEMCHYILFANGIRMEDRADNERLTDVAMFVLGMGDIFLNGFRSKNVGFNRRGHRMGYLTDNEYQFLSHEVVRLRTTGELQFQTENELRGKLLNRLSGNKQALERYLAHARQRFPMRSEPERIQALLDDFDRGR
ncbi:MAG: hypothetical protein P4L90_05115 [Rhodopila sp.]|nr:hypothetical protein [Rhodopila sp.]